MRRLRTFFLAAVVGMLLSGCFVKKKRSYGAASANRPLNYKDQKKPSRQKASDVNPAVFVFNSPQDYIQTFAPIAMEEMELYGIPASITLAQGLLESGAGQSSLVKKSNNHFGIKCHTAWRGPSTTHDDDEKGECFRKYIHPRESYRDHSLFLANGRRYAFLFEYDLRDYKSWAKGLKKAGYATDPKYPSKLIAQIKKYELDQYDRPKKARRMLRKNEVVTSRVSIDKGENHQPSLHQVQKGDTLFSISKRYGLSVEDLIKLNRLKSNNIRVGDQLKVSAQ